ncbi:hypothetical protein ACHAWF_012132 [Thalassiosira exigua]
MGSTHSKRGRADTLPTFPSETSSPPTSTARTRIVRNGRGRRRSRGRDGTTVPPIVVCTGVGIDSDREERERIFHVYTPTGKLGVILETNDDFGGPVVRGVRQTSPLADELRANDEILAVDDRDTTEMTAADVSRLISRSEGRMLTVCRRRDGGGIDDQNFSIQYLRDRHEPALTAHVSNIRCIPHRWKAKVENDDDCTEHSGIGLRGNAVLFVARCRWLLRRRST